MSSNDNFSTQLPLFDPPLVTRPQGLRYECEFLDADEESHWVKVLQALPFEPMQYKSYTARRRVVSYGGQYDFNSSTLLRTQDLPECLMPLQERVAKWLGVEQAAFTQVLVAEYRPGTPLGWHRDVPDFEKIVGVSLLHQAQMRFRPYVSTRARRREQVKLLLEPRSIYLLSGEARWDWQHSVLPTPGLRYSITFRTAASRRNT